jgi:hypothetical protein
MGSKKAWQGPTCSNVSCVHWLPVLCADGVKLTPAEMQYEVKWMLVAADRLDGVQSELTPYNRINLLRDTPC